jgi:hypothetical protein
MRRLGVIATAALIALGAGCGGDDSPDEDTAAAEQEITTALETIFTTSDPAQCTELTTTNALRQANPDAADDSELVKACKTNLHPTAEADSLEIEDVTVDGATATATVTPDGGAFAGGTATIALVDDGGWKVDEFTAIDLYDRDQFIAQLNKSLSADGAVGGTNLPAGTPECMSGYIDKEASTPALERLIVESDRKYLYDAMSVCLGGGSDLAAITLIVRKQLINGGLSKSEASCLAGVGITGLKDVTIEEFAEDPEVKKAYEKAIKESAFLCAGG